MDSRRYNDGHGLSEKFILNILTTLGCEDVKNFDYPNNDANLPNETNKNQFDSLRPDFICKLNSKKCAVEVGSINGGDYKINQLFKFVDCIIHIFSDDKFYLLNCVCYDKKIKITSNVVDDLKLFMNTISKKVDGAEIIFEKKVESNGDRGV